MSPLAVRLKLRKSFQFAEEKKRKVKLSAETHPSLQNKPTFGRISKKRRRRGWPTSMMTPHENLMKSSKEDEEVEDKCLKDIIHLMDENHVSLPY